MEWTKGDFSVDTDKRKIDMAYVHAFLARSYWAENIPPDVVKRSIQSSLCFTVFARQQQIGFARVITDEASFAYLADVFVDEGWRGQGLGTWLMECIMAYPGLQGLRRFALVTRDAHRLYRQFGFNALNNAENWMQIHKPGLYTPAPE